MNPFWVYLQLGFEHISDFAGYDHILFVLALVALYRFQDWQRVLWLVTAFTVGHSITLALATLNVLNVPQALIEFLIPITIFLTAVSNFFYQGTERQRLGRPVQGQGARVVAQYSTAAFFGLIHGLGFSNYLRALLGRGEGLVPKLLAFNLGLELGQLLIVAIMLTLTFVVVDFLRVKRREWLLIVSSGVAALAFQLILRTYPY